MVGVLVTACVRGFWCGWVVVRKCHLGVFIVDDDNVVRCFLGCCVVGWRFMG